MFGIGSLFTYKQVLDDKILDDLLIDIGTTFYTRFRYGLEIKEKVIQYKNFIEYNNDLIRIYEKLKTFYGEKDEDKEYEHNEDETKILIFLKNFKKKDILLMKRFNDEYQKRMNMRNFTEDFKLKSNYNVLLNEYNDLLSEYNKLKRKNHKLKKNNV